MTRTDLKPGDIVQHPERGHNGLAVHGDGEETRVLHLTSLGIVRRTSDLDGWERVEAVRPGHVQVRVDGLNLSMWDRLRENPQELPASTLASRAAKALAAQRTESTPPADEQEADFAIGWLNCPWCSESFTIAPRLARDAGGHVRNVGLSIVHTCPPAQPEEPTEFGAKVTFDGERWLRLNGYTYPWRNQNGVETTWDNLVKRGTVSLGWDE